MNKLNMKPVDSKHRSQGRCLPGKSQILTVRFAPFDLERLNLALDLGERKGLMGEPAPFMVYPTYDTHSELEDPGIALVYIMHSH